MAEPACRAGLVGQSVLLAMDFTGMATQLPVGVEVLQTRTHTPSLCSCMGPVLRIPWTDGLDHHAPPVAVIGADPAPRGHAHTYTGSVYHAIQMYQNVTCFFGAMQLTPRACHSMLPAMGSTEMAHT